MTVVGNKNIHITHLRIWYWQFTFVKRLAICVYLHMIPA